MQRGVGGWVGVAERERGKCARVSDVERVGMTENFVVAGVERVGKALEKDMNKEELQRILGYVNIGLAIAHDSGVSVGHFGCGDFIQLAQAVNGMLLHAIAPPVILGSDCAGVADTPAGPALAV